MLEFKCNLHLCSIKPDIIVITETWLQPEIFDQELGLIGYNVYRCDRDLELTGLQRGGGTLLAVNSSLKSILLETDPIGEQVFVRINTETENIIVCASYFAPNSDHSTYKNHFDKLLQHSNKLNNDKIIALGDYNLPKVSWFSDPLHYLPLEYISPNMRDVLSDLVHVYSDFDCVQHFTPLPSKGYTLDLLFAQPSFINILDTKLDLITTDKHHVPTVLTINTNTNHTQSKVTYRDFKNADYSAINLNLERIDWDSIVNISDLDLCVQNFYSVINAEITNNVPIKSASVQKFPAWYDNELRDLISKKNDFHRMYKQTGNLEEYIKFKQLRAQVIRLSRVKYREYLLSLEKEISSNGKRFWSYLKKLKRYPDIPNNMKYNSQSSTEDIVICELFSDYFQSTYSCSSQCLANLCSVSSGTLLFESITLEQLEVAFKKLKITSSAGPDGIPSYFIKMCWDSLRGPLLSIFNRSLYLGTFPQLWKRSFTQPVHKKGSRNEVENYRPISILNHFAKIFDSIVSSVISDFVLLSITNSQHGFIKGRSTTTNLLTFTEYIHESFFESLQTDVVYLDFSKAFDVVDHSLLMNKVWNMGIQGNIYKWLLSYLTNRYQSVRLRNCTSAFKHVPSGVPQGSNLGPILFSIFINDITSVIKSVSVLLYADDVKCYTRIRNVHDAIDLQNDVQNIYLWSLRNGLKLNLQKSSIMSYEKLDRIYPFIYRIGNTELSRVSFVSDLGIMFDGRLKFDKHIEIIIAKASKMLGFVKRNTKEFRNTSTLISMYKTLVLPYIVYACQVWSPALIRQWNLLESIQHKLLRYLSYKIGQPMSPLEHNYEPLMTHFKLPSIKQLFLYHDYLLSYKLYHNITLLPEVTNIFIIRSLNYNLRRPRQFQEYSSSLRENQNTALNRVRRLWNQVEPNVATLPLASFKQQTRRIVFFN